MSLSGWGGWVVGGVMSVTQEERRIRVEVANTMTMVVMQATSFSGLGRRDPDGFGGCRGFYW